MVLLDSNLDQFVATLDESIQHFDLISTSLVDVRNHLFDKQEERNKLKAVGTGISTVGAVASVAAGVLLTFCSGGLLAPLAVAGTVVSIGGGLVNTATDHKYKKFQEEQVKLLKKYVGKLEDVGKECDNKLEIYEACLQILRKENYDEDTARDIILTSLSEDLLFLRDTDQLFLFGTITDEEYKVRLTNSKRGIKSLHDCGEGLIVKDVLRDRIVVDSDPVKFSRGTTSGLGVLSSATILERVSNIGFASFASTGATAGKSALKNGIKCLGYLSAAISIGVTIFEIKSLISQFEEKNVLAEEVTEMIEFITRKTGTLQEFRNEIKNDDDRCKCKQVRLKVLYFNARSIDSGRKYSRQKMSKIRELLYLQMPNIVAICETWLKYDREANQIENLLCFAGYWIFREDRKRKRGGGLLVAFRDPFGFPFSFSRYHHLDRKDYLMNFLGSYRYACRKCHPTTKKFKFGFILGYRPPGLSRDDDDILDTMETNCDKIIYGHDGFAMVADFNCGKKKFSSLRQFDDYYYTNFPSTHVSGNGLDQVVYYDADFVSDAKVIDRVSDHNAIIFNLNFGKDHSSARPCQAKSCD